MKKNSLPELKIGGLTAKLPIIQGGMGIGISLARLAAAVADEGGIGVIATAGIGMFESDFRSDFPGAHVRALRKEIRRAREATSGVIGVNIMVALTNYAELANTAAKEGIDIIFSGGGLPLDLPQHTGSSQSTRLVPIVSSARAAQLICKRWQARYQRLPDAFVVEGPKAGGHLGFKPQEIDNPDCSLERLVPEVIEAADGFSTQDGRKIPVIAAGGIYSGADIARFLELGASGVQLGTRFVTTKECNASDEFKQAYIEAAAEDIIIIESPVGMPGRAIRNQFLDDVSAGKKKPYKCPYHCIRTCDFEKNLYCIFLALVNAQQGRLRQGFAFAGANAWRASEIVSVKEVMARLVSEYDDYLATGRDTRYAANAGRKQPAR